METVGTVSFCGGESDDAFLEKNSFLPELMIKWLSEELRETAVYNTILATIADEKNGKLNAMYARTGFSRAKISVYLKNLMELELVEKYCPEPMRSAILLYGFISVFCFLTRLPGEEIMAELFMKHISVRITVAL